MSDTIFIHDARFPCRIGVTPEERAEPQDVIIDVDMGIDLAAAGADDSVKETVNYVDAWTTIHDCVSQSEFRLVEALANGIATALLESHPPVEWVSVRITKPAALASRGVGRTGVLLTLRRDERHA